MSEIGNHWLLVTSMTFSLLLAWLMLNCRVATQYIFMPSDFLLIWSGATLSYQLLHLLKRKLVNCVLPDNYSRLNPSCTSKNLAFIRAFVVKRVPLLELNFLWFLTQSNVISIFVISRRRNMEPNLSTNIYIAIVLMSFIPIFPRLHEFNRTSHLDN